MKGCGFLSCSELWGGGSPSGPAPEPPAAVLQVSLSALPAMPRAPRTVALREHEVGCAWGAGSCVHAAPSPDTPATAGRASPPPMPCPQADVSPVLSAAERLSGVCIIYLLSNIYWDLVFNNCHTNISFLNPFRSAAVAILNIYQQCSCVHWLGCKFFCN